MSYLPVPYERTCDCELRSLVLPAMHGELPAVKMPRVQGEIKTKRHEKHQEQRTPHKHNREVLPRGVKNEVPHSGEAQNKRIHSSVADCG